MVIAFFGGVATPEVFTSYRAATPLGDII